MKKVVPVANENDIRKRWKKAVIHLECATDSEHFYDRIKRIDELNKLLDQGKITQDQFAEEISGKSRDIRFHGTGIFIIHEDRRYILTARHVVWDEHSAKREIQEEAERAQNWPEQMRCTIMQSGLERAQNNIFNIIFRVPSLDEVLKYGTDKRREFLMNLGAGASFTVPYTFSIPELDLALISLDQRDYRFADELIELGYNPIDSKYIEDGPSYEGSDIFTVGYPEETSLVGQMQQHPAAQHWSSSYFSLPVYAFGRVSMLHDSLPFYWADMSIYPGNSGGPVIENENLVGVVSAQATLPIDQAPKVRTRIPFAKIIKTQFVKDLLKVQHVKDERNA